MRIRSIRIGSWRNFENVELKLDDDAGLVCIVGANGTGKSHLLELVSAVAHRLGLSTGVDIPRGDPFSDPHDFLLQFYVAEAVSDAVDQGLSGEVAYREWDRTLTIEDRNVGDQTSRIVAGGIVDENERTNFAHRVISQIQKSREVHFLSLDADRAYPKKTFNIHEVAQAYEIDWAGIEYTRGRSFRPTMTLYDEWIKYFLAQENQSGTRLMQDTRRAKKLGTALPEFTDHFEGYAASLQKVLPHLLFTGVDPKKRTLLFDTIGCELSFNQLSGGEREIAFLIGQIDRFGLRQGLFLLDEPELHLNADLIRTWVSYLTNTVSTGQIWVATHSLEAVEAAGQRATFVLERDEHNRKVDSIARLDSRPVLSALSRAVGTPAFSISQLLFVFVEGEESVGERERFRRLAGAPAGVRFIECGSCNEVLRRVSAIKALANEAEAEIRIGGVVDRDFRSGHHTKEIEQNGVFIFPLHEVENFFLHPDILRVLAEQNGHVDIQPEEIVRAAADSRAGSWIFQYAMATPNAKTLPDIAANAKESAKGLSWVQIQADRNAKLRSIAGATGYDRDNQQKLTSILQIAADAYARKRQETTFWRECEGKQVLNDAARSIGFSGSPVHTQAALSAWEEKRCGLPDELVAFRNYLASL